MTFESDGGPTFPVFGDAGRLHQLFANLLDNAVKYTNCGGRIEVRLCRSGGLVTVDLQDSPPGVPANELEKLFEPLYRLEASRSRAAGGAGLGLAICRNIVEAHEGNISAHPSPLGGLRVRIERPFREDRS